jgi:hypothetical protein
MKSERYTAEQFRAASKLLWNALNYVEGRGLGKAENPYAQPFSMYPNYFPKYISAADILRNLAFDVNDLANAKGGRVSHDTAAVLFGEEAGGD